MKPVAGWFAAAPGVFVEFFCVFNRRYFPDQRGNISKNSPSSISGSNATSIYVFGVLLGSWNNAMNTVCPSTGRWRLGACDVGISGGSCERVLPK